MTQTKSKIKDSASVDFIIIGAQKSATTSLFEYLREHPIVYMPPEKEVNFFSDDVKYARGLSWYLREYFSKSPNNAVRGEASPSYMYYENISKRIYDTIPDVKLIALLRNPISRAFSHYRMSYRRGSENRDFPTCVSELTTRKKTGNFKNNIEGEYISLGEYGRILSNYLVFFSKMQIKIVFMENLVLSPVETMKQIFHFLNVLPEDFNSPIFGKTFHQGGDKKYHFLDKFAHSKISTAFIRTLLPNQLRRSLGFWYITRFTVKAKKYEEPDQNTVKELYKYYKKDVLLLEECFGVKVPWREFC